MRKNGLYCIISTILVATTFLQGCIKEYSYEGRGMAPVVADTLPPMAAPATTPDFPPCSSCEDKDRFEEGRWSFKAGESFLCGIIDTALINIERTAFTFFGPSACSPDTNMIISVYLEPHVLNKNQHDLVIPKIAFYFNKKDATHHLLVSRPGTPFSVTINEYNHQTKMVTGSFRGNAYKADGKTILVHSAKFRVKLL